MNIQLPKGKGVPLSPYPKEMYEQLFGCATLNCDFTLNFQIPMIVPPNAVVLFDKSDWVWRCPKCGCLQTTIQDLPRSVPLGKMELKKQGGENGSSSKKRKPKPKKKEDDGEQNPVS